MIGLVVVSHSRALASAAAELALQMAPAAARPAVEIAAGLADGSLGTSADAVAAAIERADSGDGVVVLVDLGSALLSAETGVEFCDPDLAARVTLSPAPLVEGLVAAVVAASAGFGAARVAAEAERGLLGKQEHLGVRPPAKGTTAADEVAWRATLTAPDGLHLRPAAALVAALEGLDADVTLANATTGAGPVPADSVTWLATLDARCGHGVAATVGGPDAGRALAALDAWAAGGFAEIRPAG